MSDDCLRVETTDHYLYYVMYIIMLLISPQSKLEIGSILEYNYYEVLITQLLLI